MIATIGNIAILILFVFGLLWLRNQFPSVDAYWRNGVIWLFVGLALIHLGIYWWSPGYWREWSSHGTFLVFQLILWFGFFLISRKDIKFLHPIGMILVVFGVVLGIWSMWGAFQTHQIASNLMTPTKLSMGLPKQDFKVEKIVTKFWKKHLPEKDALAMLRIVRRESGFNQFESDGQTVYRNRTKKSKIGVMQIDQNLWWERARELGYNLETLEGNLNFALWLYKEHGFEPWTDPMNLELGKPWEKLKSPFGEGHWGFSTPDSPPLIQDGGPGKTAKRGTLSSKENLVVTAATDVYTEKMDVRGFRAIDTTGSVYVLEDDSTIPFVYSPGGGPVKIGRPKTMRFKSAAGKPVTVNVTF